MPKTQRCCIFCGGAGLTREHLFSDWLRQLFPRSATDTHTVGVSEGTPYRLTQHQGHSGTKKIRTPCRVCNSGWMSQIDEAAKPLVSPLILGEHAVVSPQAQIILSAWFTKTAIIGDSRNLARSMVPDAQRQLLKDWQRPPIEWEIWLMSYHGTDFRNLGLHQNGGLLNITPIAGPGEKATGYVKTTFIGIGRLAVLVVANDMPMTQFSIGTLAMMARRIWPVSDPFEWPINPSIGDEDAIAAADILKHMIMNPRMS